MLAGLVGYARERWPSASTVHIRPPIVAAGAAIIYAAAMILWSIGGPAWGGPAGFDTVAIAATRTLAGQVVPTRPAH